MQLATPLCLLGSLAIAGTTRAQDAYLVDSTIDQLFTVDLVTGAATLIASTANNGLTTPADLSYRAATGELWTIDLDGGEVGTLDVRTGTFRPIFQTSLSGWQGLAWDEVTKKFYLANQNGNNYVLDPATGATTVLGASGAGLITCLDTDAAGNLFGIGFSTGNVLAIDKTSGAATVQSTTLAGFQGLGIHQQTGVWFASDTNTDSLYRVVPGTGANTLVGVHGAGVGFAKGFDLVDRPVRAYAVDSNLDLLYSIDLATGDAAAIGSTANNGLATPADLTYRAATGQLWTIDLDGGEVGTLDVTNATFTVVYQTNLSGWQGMAWDETTQRFYLANQNGNNYVLDPATGTTTLLGAAGTPLICSLDVGPCGTLFGIGVGTGAVVSIDKNTGAATLLSTTIGGFQGLGIEQGTGRWYATHVNNDSLHIVDPTTGGSTLVGAHGLGIQFVKGFEVVDEPRAYLADSNSDELFSVDLLTGAATRIASTANNGLATPADLSYRAATRQLWTIDLSGGEVGTIHTSTGVFTPVFQTGLSGWQAIAWDEVTQRFYLANQNGTNYVLDPATGVTTALGAAGGGLIVALDTDASGNLVGTGFSPGFLLSIDKVTGAATALNSTTAGLQGLGIDQGSGWMYGANTNDSSLYRIDPATGTATLVGAHGAGVTFAKGFDLVDPAGTTLATQTAYGSACGGLNLTALTRPVLCNGWQLSLSVPPNSQLAALGLGFSNPGIGLGPIGAPGCTQYTDALAVILLLVPLPSPAYTVAMPSDPFFVGLSLFAQGFALVPGLNPLNVGASNGLRGTIGHF